MQIYKYAIIEMLTLLRHPLGLVLHTDIQIVTYKYTNCNIQICKYTNCDAIAASPRPCPTYRGEAGYYCHNAMQ